MMITMKCFDPLTVLVGSLDSVQGILKSLNLYLSVTHIDGHYMNQFTIPRMSTIYPSDTPIM